MKNKFAILLTIACIFVTKTSFGDEEQGLSLNTIDSSRFFKIATLQLLDKTTAKTSIIKIGVGEKKDFGRIKIGIDKCWQAPLDQKPDSKILLEIFEKEKNKEKRIFYGWLIASSPSVSGLEHPVYDVIALSCKNE